MTKVVPRVLVVEDNDDARELMADLLATRGYETRAAADALAALELAVEFRPTIAVIDIGLPGADGYDLARRLRLLEGLERLLIVAVTGYGNDSDRRLSAAAGIDIHLVKPVDLGSLTAAFTQPPG